MSKRMSGRGARGASSAHFAALLFLGAIGGSADCAQAQSVPNDCRPAGGQNYDCATTFPGPYIYLAGSCGGPVFQSEGPAVAAYREQFAGFQCPISFAPVGWITAGPVDTPDDFIVSCASGSSTYPHTYYGQESTTWLLEEVTKENGAYPLCGDETEYTWGAVRRERNFSCPEGYVSYTSDVCYRGSNQRDYAKMIGDSCPPKGQCQSPNPINIGAGNKYRAERDYRAGGTSPLAFTRYYNSLAHNPAFAHHYRDSNYELSGGTGAYGASALQASEQGGRYGALALGAVGVGWRHTYQRVIDRQIGSVITSAYVFREDGQVLTFTKMSGTWYGQADVNLKLEETVDGGGAQSGFKLTLEDDSTETYDLAGKLTKIRGRSGIEQTLAYDGCGRLQSVTDSFGRALALAYASGCGATAAQRIVTLTVPGGGTFTYGYDSAGRLATVTDPNHETRTYHYENTTFSLALTGITDESSQRFASFAYDSYGRELERARRWRRGGEHRLPGHGCPGAECDGDGGRGHGRLHVRGDAGARESRHAERVLRRAARSTRSR